jgi:hypothetical protein
MEPKEKPRLVMATWVTGEPFAYQCSYCRKVFLLPEDREPKNAAIELLAAFQEHLGEEHANEATN